MSKNKAGEEAHPEPASVARALNDEGFRSLGQGFSYFSLLGQPSGYSTESSSRRHTGQGWWAARLP